MHSLLYWETPSCFYNKFNTFLFRAAAPSPQPSTSQLLRSVNRGSRRSSSPLSPINSNRRNTADEKIVLGNHIVTDRKQLAKIKIIVPNSFGKIRDVPAEKLRRRLGKGANTLEKLLQLVEDGKIAKAGDRGTQFNTQEYETPSEKELRKIQVVPYFGIFPNKALRTTRIIP